MTSPRRTPSYVPVIGKEPTGPQLMGPHQALREPLPNPASSPQPPHHPGRRSSSDILELRPGLVERAELLEPAGPATVPVERRRVAAVERRPLEVIILSAIPGVAPRHVQVARWQIRAVLSALSVVTLLACGLIAALGVAVGSPGLFVPRSSVELIEAELSAAQDSLDALRVAVDEAERVADSTAAAAAAALSVNKTAMRPALTRPSRPWDARRSMVTADVDDDARMEMPRVITDLPVIGALASRFSMARRHPVHRRVRPHLGVDVAAPRGTRVSAPAPGRVKFVGRRIGYGLVVELNHGQGITTRYAHLRSSAVQVGEQVTRGEAIAAVGTSGLSTGPHLHYEVLVDGRQVDPLRFRFPDGSMSTSPAPASASPPVPVPAPTVPVTVVPGGVSAGTQDALPPAPVQQLPH